MKTLARAVLVVFGLGTLVVALSPVLAYLYGTTLLPRDRSPAPSEPGARVARELLWRDFDGEGTARIPVLNPYTHFSYPNGPGTRLAVAAGRMLMRPEKPPRPWAPAYFAAIVWVSRHWSADDALSTVLARSYYGHGIYGLDDAAQAYFALPIDSLDSLETAQLVALTRASSTFDPWCRPERSLRRARMLTRDPEANASSRVTPAPAGACE